MKTAKIFGKCLGLLTFLGVAPAAFCAVPIINGFSPTSGSSGTAVTITGANFDALSTNDIVYFGPVRATITAATPTNVVAIVPNGAMYAPITVTVGGLVAYSIAPFKPTFSGTGAAFDSTSFAPRLDIPVPSGPTRVAVGDFDGDGKPDLIIASIYAHQITLLQNISTNGSIDTNSFAAPVYFPFANSAQSPYWLVAGDVDGDGKIDIIAPDEAGNQILVYRNISSGGILTSNSFAAPIAFAVGMAPRNIALRDLDGDGRPDLVVANIDDNTVSILKNIGTAGMIDTNSFAPQIVLQAGSQPHDIAVADLDGDGKPDLAVNNYTSPYVSLFRNVTAPGVLDTNSFDAQVTLAAPLYCNSVILADMDGDGKQDLLISTAQGNNEVSIYRNIATPGPLSTNSFGPELDYPAAGWVSTVAAGDLNGDGKLDVALVNQMDSTFSVFQNVGAGSFTNTSLANRVDYGSGLNPYGAVIVDLDGDGRPDVVFGNGYSSSLSIYRNLNGTGTAPVITSQPGNRTVVAGSNVTFSVTATGSATLHYQWYFGEGTFISSSSNPTLTLSNVQPSSAGNYFVIVTNQYGTATSSNAVLTVNPASATCTPAPSGLVSWWKAEGNAIDSVGGNNGVLSNGVGFAAGEVGQGFLFTQTNQDVKIPANPSLDVGVGGGLTLEAWINPSDVTKYDPIFEWNAGDGVTYWGVHLYIIPTGVPNDQSGILYADVQDVADGWHQIQSSDTVIAANSLQHVALTYDKASGVARLYCNGTLVAQTTFGSFTPKTTGNLNIGNRPTDPANEKFTFSGVIDEPAVYNRALASNEIAAIYNAGSSGKCDPLPAAPAITTQPADRTVTAGSTTTFSVVATGTQPLTYQWSGPVGIISGGTNSLLTLSNVQPANAGAYHVLVSNAYGSTNSSNATLTVNFGTPAIRVVNTAVPGGSSVDVPVTILANGNENGLSFSLNFDPTRLVYSGVSLGSGASDALILPNVGQASSGKIGIQLALPSGETFGAGTQELVRVTFSTAILTGTQPVVTAVSFTSLPISKLLSDVLGHALPATFVNGTVTLSTSPLEGEAAPLPNGNGSIDLFDWIQVGRFVAGLDTITNGAEFQKVDCAPRDTLGDGQLKVTDWVQAGRYAAGLDPLTIAGGPTGPLTPAISKAQPSGSNARQVTVSSGSTVKGMTVTLPVTLEAQGDETALAFSLNFDPKVLQYVGTVKGSDASSAVLNVNSSHASSGQLAIVLGLPAGGSHFTAGTKELAKVSFVALASATNNSVGFADQPLLRSISDANAVELSASYVANSVVVNPQPQINMSLVGNSPMLSWPVWAGDFTLQAAGNLVPPITWTNVPIRFQTNGGNVEVTLPTGGQQTFFRLYHP